MQWFTVAAVNLVPFSLLESHTALQLVGGVGEEKVGAHGRAGGQAGSDTCPHPHPLARICHVTPAGHTVASQECLHTLKGKPETLGGRQLEPGDARDALRSQEAMWSSKTMRTSSVQVERPYDH